MAKNTQVVETAPKRIWLQISDDAYDADNDFPEPASDQITWCADSVMDVEVKYIRADLVAELIDKVDSALAFGWNDTTARELRSALDRVGGAP